MRGFCVRFSTATLSVDSTPGDSTGVKNGLPCREVLTGSRANFPFPTAEAAGAKTTVPAATTARHARSEAGPTENRRARERRPPCRSFLFHLLPCMHTIL